MDLRLPLHSVSPWPNSRQGDYRPTTIRHSDGKEPGIRSQDNRKTRRAGNCTPAHVKESTINCPKGGILKFIRLIQTNQREINVSSSDTTQASLALEDILLIKTQLNSLCLCGPSNSHPPYISCPPLPRC